MLELAMKRTFGSGPGMWLAGSPISVFSFQTFVKDTSDLVGGGAPEAEERVLPLLFSAFRG